MITHISRRQLYYIAFRRQFNYLKTGDPRPNTSFNWLKERLKVLTKKNGEMILIKHVKKEEVIKSWSCSEIFMSFSSLDWLREGGQGRVTLLLPNHSISTRKEI